MESTWINTKLFTAISAILLTLVGCSDSNKTDQTSVTMLKEYRGFKFGTPIWELLHEKQCDISSHMRETALEKILYENTESDERMAELRRKMPDLSSEEIKELAALEKLDSIAGSMLVKINRMTESDFIKECYQKSDKLFGLDANQSVTGIGKSMRDICSAAFSRDMVSCAMKSELNPEDDDFILFDGDSKGRLATIRVYYGGYSVKEYQDAQRVIEKLESINNIKASMLTQTGPSKTEDMVQWSLSNNQILVTWTPAIPRLELAYQATGSQLVDSADELYNQAKLLDSNKKVEENKSLIFNWYLLSAQRGHAAAQLSVGNMFKREEGIEHEDIFSAKMWYVRSADQGNAESQYQLAHIYDKNAPENKVEALRWYKRAAEQGHGFAQNNLASMYINGEGTSKDIREAYKWYQKSAEQGVELAQFSLGWIYEKGMLGSPDYAEALKWYQKAADQGLSDAQNNLGTMYDYGNGVPRDISIAIAWYKKSAAQGNEIAKSNLAKLEAQSK